MFGKMAADALGISDIGKIIGPADYDKVDADDYIMHEENEKIFFVIKSKADEYCFTNTALIHLDGSSAMSKKRMLRRKTYASHPLSEVFLETAGTVDLDVEIKFHMGDSKYSIDVTKKQLEQLKDLYKALLRIASIQKENRQMHSYALKSLDLAAQSLPRNHSTEASSEQFKHLNEYSFTWMQEQHKTFVRKDFGAVFEKFINN